MTVNNAADGSGTNTVTPLTTLAGTATTETFTYTAPIGGMTNGAVSIDVPAGWTAPQLGAGAGQTTSSTGTVAVAGQTATVSGVSLNAGATLTITYAGGVATTTAGAANWTSKQKSTVGGTLANISVQPSVTVNNAADGTGTNTVTPLTTLAGTTTTETFTYTAPTGGMTNGAVSIDIPAGWTAPQLGAGAAQVTSNVGTVSVAGQTITVDSLNRNAGQTVTITYAGGIATTTTGAANWTTKQKSTAGSTLTNIAARPVRDGRQRRRRLRHQHGRTADDARGRRDHRDLHLHRPDRRHDQRRRHHRRPRRLDSTTDRRRRRPGHRQHRHRRRRRARPATVSGVTLNAGATLTITYTAGTATTTTGAATWTTKQKSTAGGTLTPIGTRPSVTVNNAADGTGTNTVTPLTTLAGTASTETFTYTAPTGGMTNGAVSIDVPAGSDRTTDRRRRRPGHRQHRHRRRRRPNRHSQRRHAQRRRHPDDHLRGWHRDDDDRPRELDDQAEGDSGRRAPQHLRPYRR